MMSSYTSYDFKESVRQKIEPSEIENVIAAWGNVDREGACCDACGGEWSGGFLLKLKDSRFAYLSGWCDYTGWGCQDGTNITFYDVQPELSSLEEHPADKWDMEPTDLNAWLQAGGKFDDW